MNEVKEKIVKGLQEQAENNLGMSMTFTLFEWLKEEKGDLLKDQPSEPVAPSSTTEDITNEIGCISINEDNVRIRLN